MLNLALHAIFGMKFAVFLLGYFMSGFFLRLEFDIHSPCSNKFYIAGH